MGLILIKTGYSGFILHEEIKNTEKNLIMLCHSAE